MISRIWHGWTTFKNAPVYENLLRAEVFPSIESKKVKSYKKISLLKRELENEVEFITIMLFEDMEAVGRFAGVDHEKSYVPDKAKKVLSGYDARAQHYEIINEIFY